VEKTAFEINHLSQISDLRDFDLDHGSGHMAYHQPLPTFCLPTKFRSNWRNILWMDGHWSRLY